MILAIDTSAGTSVLATIEEENGRIAELELPARSPELIPELHRLARGAITKVAVATGPGSFTGLRVGVSFGLGLAMGRRIPIVPLPTLDLQAARSEAPVIAVVEAGRGRFYFLVPGEGIGHGGPGQIPSRHPLVGRVSPKALAELEAAGHEFVPALRLRPFGRAVMILLETAREVAYGSLEIEYMQTFSARS